MARLFCLEKTPLSRPSCDAEAFSEGASRAKSEPVPLSRSSHAKAEPSGMFSHYLACGVAAILNWSKLFKPDSRFNRCKTKTAEPLLIAKMTEIFYHMICYHDYTLRQAQNDRRSSVERRFQRRVRI